MRIGDIVKIADGPLVGRLAQFAGTARGKRALIVVDLDGRELTVEIDLSWIAAIAPERKSVSGIQAPRRRSSG